MGGKRSFPDAVQEAANMLQLAVHLGLIEPGVLMSGAPPSETAFRHMHSELVRLGYMEYCEADPGAQLTPAGYRRLLGFQQ